MQLIIFQTRKLFIPISVTSTLSMLSEIERTCINVSVQEKSMSDGSSLNYSKMTAFPCISENILK